MSGGEAVVANAWLDRMLAFWSPGWTLGGCLIAAAVAFAVRRPVARAGELTRRYATIYVLGVGVALAVTLSPRSTGDTYYIFGPVAPRCDLRLAPEDLVAAASTAQWYFNLALLVPVGIACGAARTARGQRRLLLVAAAVPVAVEGIQYLAPTLHRVCQGLDLATNWVSLLVGWAGMVAWRRAVPPHHPSNPAVPVDRQA